MRQLQSRPPALGFTFRRREDNDRLFRLSRLYRWAGFALTSMIWSGAGSKANRAPAGDEIAQEPRDIAANFIDPISGSGSGVRQ
jgi:hypothetical protein